MVARFHWLAGAARLNPFPGNLSIPKALLPLIHKLGCESGCRFVIGHHREIKSQPTNLKRLSRAKS